MKRKEYKTFEKRIKYEYNDLISYKLKQSEEKKLNDSKFPLKFTQNPKQNKTLVTPLSIPKDLLEEINIRESVFDASKSTFFKTKANRAFRNNEFLQKTLSNFNFKPKNNYEEEKNENATKNNTTEGIISENKNSLIDENNIEKHSNKNLLKISDLELKNQSNTQQNSGIVNEKEKLNKLESHYEIKNNIEIKNYEFEMENENENEHENILSSMNFNTTTKDYFNKTTKTNFKRLNWVDNGKYVNHDEIKYTNFISSNGKKSFKNFKTKKDYIHYEYCRKNIYTNKQASMLNHLHQKYDLIDKNFQKNTNKEKCDKDILTDITLDSLPNSKNKTHSVDFLKS